MSNPTSLSALSFILNNSAPILQSSHYLTCTRSQIPDPCPNCTSTSRLLLRRCRPVNRPDNNPPMSRLKLHARIHGESAFLETCSIVGPSDDRLRDLQDPRPPSHVGSLDCLKLTDVLTYFILTYRPL
ncbi:hypothetical protein SISNIDRAFT_221201 [Sistotremastrum niveocremeum HHB9708]|uniref:Uncharacterized protein n=1 Tax=Sistotremastrum niveocremeum HHB9708 TaxID=1314777 RepID=A0A164QLP3_9AGAM|nr:hypothetical protein SISNIDRAFT_221201 [Sistotremastrum niveocremeum HHB9708]